MFSAQKMLSTELRCLCEEDRNMAFTHICIACVRMDVQDLYRPLVLVIVPPIKCSQTAWYCGYWVLKCEDSTDADVVHLFIKMIRVQVPKV